MIIFDLACKNNHNFEGWFQSQEAFDSQLGSGLIACPDCGSVEIRRVPSAIHLSKSTTTASSDVVPVVTPQGDLLGAYQKLMSAIVANCEDVGKEFANEARKIHYMEARARSIRGEASAEDFESLREEGIEVLRLPSVKKEELN
jgi:hypothetical protein